MPEKLTRKQARALKTIQTLAEAGIPPSLREIAAMLNVRHTTVRQYVQVLERKGWLRRAAGRARSIELFHSGAQGRSFARSVPIIGRVSAGLPFLSEEHIEGHLVLDDRQLRGNGLFVLRVEGDSMTGANIEDGDYVVARSQVTADDGEIVVARIGIEVTVKRLQRVGRKWYLQPENRRYRRILIEEDGGIQGKVIAVFRTIL